MWFVFGLILTLVGAFALGFLSKGILGSFLFQASEETSLKLMAVFAVVVVVGVILMVGGGK